MNFTSRYSNALMGVTQAGAIAAAHLMGYGDKHGADQASVSAMEQAFMEIPCCFHIVTGEGERDKAPLLYHGQRIGGGCDEESNQIVDIAIDPLEGTNLCAYSKPNSISILAASPSGGIRSVPDWYFQKLVVGFAARGKVDINAPIMENVRIVADSLNRDPEDLVVGILDRPRHREVMETLKKNRVRIRRIDDGDLSIGLAVALAETNIHMGWGIGGAPEGLITAVGMSCLNGEIQLRLPREDELTADEWAKAPDRLQERLNECGFKNDVVYQTGDVITSKELLLVATGVTNGDILKGVRFFHHGCRTNTLLLGRNGDETSRALIDNVVGGNDIFFRL